VAGNDNIKEHQQADPAGKPAGPSRLRLPLKDLRDVQRELARVYRAMKADQMPLVKGRTLVYALSMLSRSIEGSELERRVVMLEQQLGDRPRRR